MTLNITRVNRYKQNSIIQLEKEEEEEERIPGLTIHPS